MKKLIILLVVLLASTVIPARADVYVIVDSNGVVVSGAIVCDAGTCGDPNSLYSRLTLKAGERYVLQGRTDSNGNNSGIGAQPNQILVVKEEPTKNTFVAITPTQTTVIVTPTVVEPQPTPEPKPQPVAPTPTPTPTNTTETSTVITETSTVTTVADTATVGAVINSDTTTTTTAPVETQPEPEIPLFSESLIEWLARWQELWAEFLLWLES